MNRFIKALLKMVVGILAVQGSVQATRRDFPQDAPFSEQHDWVQGLPKGCPESSARILDGLKGSQNPFTAEVSIPSNTKVEIQKHSIYPEHGSATRRTRVISPEANEVSSEAQQTEILIGGQGSDNALVHKFQLTPNGDWKPTSVEERSINDYHAGIPNDHVGYVAKVHYEQNRCYQSWIDEEEETSSLRIK